MNNARHKRWLSSLLVLVMACSLLPVQVFAAEGDCAHTNKETITGTPATCTVNGTTDGVYCGDCNTWVTPQTTINAPGHNHQPVKGYAASCTEPGLTDGEICTVCGDVKTAQEEIPSLGGHTVTDMAYLAPTCEEPGHEGGTYCSVCQTVFEQATVIPATGHNYKSTTVTASCDGAGYTQYTCQNVGCGHTYQDDVASATGHTWDEGIVTEEPSCTEDGERLFTCSVCYGTKTEVEPATGHNMVDVPAKPATYASAGYDAYEKCVNPACGYNTCGETVPALERSNITDFDTFMKYLKILEDVANDYARENPGKDPLGVLIKYIRTGVDRYNSGSWNIMAGYEDAGFAKYVEKYEENYNVNVATKESEMIQLVSMKNINNFKLPNGQTTDIGHMFGTLDISYTNRNSVDHADVAGWAGDLCDLLSLVDQYEVTGTLSEMVEEIASDYFLRASFPVEPIEGTFSQTDFYGDLDGFYVMDTLNSQDYEKGLLYTILDEYFTEDLTDADRADYMLRNRMDGISSLAGLRDKVYSEYTANQVVHTLEQTRTYTASSSDLTELRRACCYVFADYLCMLAGDYVESGENIYYTVFSTNTSVLAPGITQEINMAHTADGKQIKYYIATADITSEYVSVYANYMDREPTEWGMSRVRDQMLAAQEKYGNPESEDYIENYTVIAGVNGAGYNMTTGEPGGLLVMGGVEYHAPNANGFFGILSDGTPYIGTTAEYYELKAEGKVMEGIAGFGATLVQDGELCVSYTDSYTSNRASRTAVGITRTGKVVFMVMDGRQEPVSCGGSMQEIAQVMLEAGCIHAINLDGGGSTTYVAQQEGDSEISLVSSPSDGFERSVSTSLLMVSTAPSSTAFDHAVLEVETSNYLTVGSSVQLTASGVSPMGNAVEVPEGVTWSVADTTIGSIDEDGVFTATKNGSVDVRLMLDGEIVGSIALYVVTPDALYFSKTTLDAVYGANTVLPVKALYNNKTVIINEDDVTFTLTNSAAGTINGFVFVGDESSGLRNVSVIATLVADSSITASAAIVLYNQGEASFDFDQATGGDRQLAWDRQVSNSTTDDNITYMAEVVGEDMVTSYIFAIDMTQIPFPEQLEDLKYMLPGSDVEGANTAWSFLLQLAERVHPNTEVTPSFTFDKNLDVDYSNITIVNEYFELKEGSVQFDEETNTLTLVLNWIDQTKSIDPDTANPLCILSGITATPKADAEWDSQDRLSITSYGDISYTIYLRANALYSFAQKEENQQTYALYPYSFGENESGAYFSSTYKEILDQYTLINAGKNGWIYEEGGYAYYVDGVKHTGICKVDGYYYDFGTNGINAGQNKYTGLFEESGITHYAQAGVLSTGWVKLGDQSYYFDEDGDGYNGTMIVDEVEMIFDDGLLVGGHTGFIKKSDGKTYYYEAGLITYSWKQINGTWYHFNAVDGSMTTGTKVLVDAESTSKNAYYDFAEDGKLLRAYFNPAGYYYWVGLPLANEWVKNGADPDPDAWYRTNGSGHYVTDSNKNNATVRIAITGADGVAVVYTFDNSCGKLIKGDVVNNNGTLYYYWAGQPMTDCWYTTMDGDTYYAYADGHLATGTQTINGETYTFAADGKAQNITSAITATLSDDKSTLEIALAGAMGRDSARFGIWLNTDFNGTLRWVDGEKGADGIWRASVNMCEAGLTGTFSVHAYVSTSGYEVFQADTMVDVSEIGHVYTNDQDTTCNHCGYEREIAPAGPALTIEPVVSNHTVVISLTPAEECTNVRYAFWANDDRDYTLRWENASFNGTAWVANVPQCALPVAGEYTLHVYDFQGDNAVLVMESSFVVDEANLMAHTYSTATDHSCDVCETIRTVPMFRMYDPNSSEHFYTGSEEERDILIAEGWNYEGVAFNFPAAGAPVYRLYNPVSGDHLYTMDQAEIDLLTAGDWNVEGVAFNSAADTEVAQYRLWNPNATRGAWHFTGSEEERDFLISLGWQYQGIGWYSSLR